MCVTETTPFSSFLVLCVDWNVLRQGALNLTHFWHLLILLDMRATSLNSPTFVFFSLFKNREITNKCCSNYHIINSNSTQLEVAIMSIKIFKTKNTKNTNKACRKRLEKFLLNICFDYFLIFKIVCQKPFLVFLLSARPT